VTGIRPIDRAVSRALKLPPPTTGYRVHRRLPVPMRDGVILRADHYSPETHRPLGTILVRGPYGRELPFSIIYAQVYAARGYHVVFQSVRGTFGSFGVDVGAVGYIYPSFRKSTLLPTSTTWWEG
jgi:predicted acyl esterase